MSIRRSARLAILLSLAGLSPGHADQPFDPVTRSALQSVISQQLEAFAHDDAKAAETFAAPGIRQRFPEPDKFFAMVKENYGALVHPKSTQFGETRQSPQGPLQTVTVVAADGTVWTAIYSFEQIDGAWRITGCGLQKVQGQQDI